MNHSILAIGIALLASLVGTNSTVVAADTHVKASLIADVSAIHPSKSFTIGVLLEIDPGWHVYWTNPGDSGMATSVKFKLPAGFTVAPDPFPVPRRIQQPGNEVVYGYENAVLISARVTPPADLRKGDDVAIRAAAGWLVCKEACMPGKAAVDLTMKVADHAESANAATFEREGTTVMPARQSPADVNSVHWGKGSSSPVALLTVNWKSPVSEIELFPGADDAVTVSAITVGKTEGGTTSISLKVTLLSGQKPNSDELPVLIAYRDAKGKMRGFETSVPLK